MELNLADMERHRQRLVQHLDLLNFSINTAVGFNNFIRANRKVDGSREAQRKLDISSQFS